MRGAWTLRLSAIAVVATVIQIVLGAVVRLTDSGLSCPDWPLCYGLWFPTPAKLAAMPHVDYTFAQVMFEWVHRLNAAAVIAPLTLGLAVAAWRGRTAAPAAWQLMPAALALLIVQAGLGGLTVLDRNSPWSVAVHLSVALIFLTVLIWVHLAARDRAQPAGPPPTQGPWLIGFAALVILATIASGAMMAKSGASLACASWPLCNGALIPALDDPAVQYNFGHRVLALLAVGLVATCFITSRTAAGDRYRKAIGWATLGMAAQVLLGAGVVAIFAGDSLTAQVAIGAGHQALAVITFGLIVTALWIGRAARNHD